jgi:hypothetical protein
VCGSPRRLFSISLMQTRRCIAPRLRRMPSSQVRVRV